MTAKAFVRHDWARDGVSIGALQDHGGSRSIIAEWGSWPAFTVNPDPMVEPDEDAFAAPAGRRRPGHLRSIGRPLRARWPRHALAPQGLRRRTGSRGSAHRPHDRANTVSHDCKPAMTETQLPEERHG